MASLPMDKLAKLTRSQIRPHSTPKGRRKVLDNVYIYIIIYNIYNIILHHYCCFFGGCLVNVIRCLIQTGCV